MKTTQSQIQSAYHAARKYISAQKDMNNAAMQQAGDALFGVVGYWQTPRIMTAGQFRGDVIPPKMARMPRGTRNIRWDVAQVAKAWAEEATNAPAIAKAGGASAERLTDPEPCGYRMHAGCNYPGLAGLRPFQCATCESGTEENKIAKAKAERTMTR